MTFIQVNILNISLHKHILPRGYYIAYHLPDLDQISRHNNCNKDNIINLNHDDIGISIIDLLVLGRAHENESARK